MPPATNSAADAVVAAIVDAPGREPRIGSIVLPPRASGWTRVAVIAAPLNPLDLLIASGTFHSARHESPYVPGSECVGLVLESDHWPPGTLVYGECHATPERPGALAAEALIADEDLLQLPEDIDPVAAAAVGNSGTAAYLPLVETVRMRPGETVLVLGATGSVGQLAVQVAHALGAGRVIAAGRDRETLDRLLSFGADAVVELRAAESPDDLAARLEPVTGPVDVVFDCVFGVPFEAALRVCAQRARLVNVGHGAGAETVVPAGLLRGKQLTISGFAGIHTTLHEKGPALGWLWSALKSGQLSVTPHSFQFDELPEVWRAQSSSPHAKFVLVPA